MTDRGASHLEAALLHCGMVTLTLGLASIAAEKLKAPQDLCVANACPLPWHNLALQSADERSDCRGRLCPATALDGNTVLRSLCPWSNSTVSDKSAAMSSTSSKGRVHCLKSSAVEQVRLDWTAVSRARREVVRKACVANAARNP